MRVRPWMGFGLVVMLFWVAGPTLAKGRSVRVTYVEGQAVVQAGATATYAAQCPRSYQHPVGGEFDRLSSGVSQLALAASYPRGQRGWVVVIDNLSNQAQGYFAGIVCVGANARFAYPRTTAVVEPKKPGGGGVGCPRTAPHAINDYFGAQSATDLGKTVLTDNGAGGPAGKQGAFAFVENLSDVPVGLFGGAVCTSLRNYENVTAYNTLQPGMNDGWNFACPPQTPIAVGSLLVTKANSDTGTIAVTGSGRLSTGRKWWINFMSLTNHPVTYFAGAVCIG